MQTVGRIRRLHHIRTVFSLNQNNRASPPTITPDTATIAPVSHKALAGNALRSIISDGKLAAGSVVDNASAGAVPIPASIIVCTIGISAAVGMTNRACCYRHRHHPHGCYRQHHRHGGYNQTQRHQTPVLQGCKPGSYLQKSVHSALPQRLKKPPCASGMSISTGACVCGVSRTHFCTSVAISNAVASQATRRIAAKPQPRTNPINTSVAGFNTGLPSRMPAHRPSTPVGDAFPPRPEPHSRYTSCPAAKTAFPAACRESAIAERTQQPVTRDQHLNQRTDHPRRCRFPYRGDQIIA